MTLNSADLGDRATSLFPVSGPKDGVISVRYDETRADTSLETMLNVFDG